MASVGINFRATSGYVTDGAGETYCLGQNDIYPTTRGGYTFGWDSDALITGQLNRDNAIDVRLAGINYRSNDGTQTTFRLNFGTSGSKNVRIALGDAGGAQGYQYLRVLDSDGTTVLLTIDDTNGTASANFDDATPGAGTSYSAANWPGSNSPQAITLSGTAVYVKIGSPTSQSGSTTLAHFYIEDAGGGVTISPSVQPAPGATGNLSTHFARD